MTDPNLDNETLPFPDGYFDVVFALEVFEHFSNPQFAIEEIKRLLKDGGTLLISTPTQWCYHWPRLFYPSLLEGENFTEFLMANGFSAEKVENWFLQIPYNKQLNIPLQMKVWNWFWISEKIDKTDAKSFLELGTYFWNKINKFGIRERPLEALEFFQKSYNADGNEAAWLSLTHALLYRFLCNDTEEFTSFWAQLLTKIEDAITPPVTCPYVLTLTRIVFEAERFGHRIVDDEVLLKLRELASRTPHLKEFCKDLHLDL